MCSFLFKRLVSGSGDIKLTKDGNVLLHEMVWFSLSCYQFFVIISDRKTCVCFVFSKSNTQQLLWSRGRPQRRTILQVTVRPQASFSLASFFPKLPDFWPMEYIHESSLMALTLPGRKLSKYVFVFLWLIFPPAHVSLVAIKGTRIFESKEGHTRPRAIDQRGPHISSNQASRRSCWVAHPHSCWCSFDNQETSTTHRFIYGWNYDDAAQACHRHQTCKRYSPTLRLHAESHVHHFRTCTRSRSETSGHA